MRRLDMEHKVGHWIGCSRWRRIVEERKCRWRRRSCGCDEHGASSLVVAGETTIKQSVNFGRYRGVFFGTTMMRRRAKPARWWWAAHYQSTFMDLVEASLLAAGSMCGSSIAPGSSDGTLITGEALLQATGPVGPVPVRGALPARLERGVRGGGPRRAPLAHAAAHHDRRRHG